MPTEQIAMLIINKVLEYQRGKGVEDGEDWKSMACAYVDGVITGYALRYTYTSRNHVW